MLPVEVTITLNTPDVFRFSAVDSRGLPVKNADIRLRAYRPSDASADFQTSMDSIAPGLYQTSLSFPLPGIWDLKLSIQHGEDRVEMQKRLSVQPLTSMH